MSATIKLLHEECESTDGTKRAARSDQLPEDGRGAP
jgi:hypothetical protein